MQLQSNGTGLDLFPQRFWPRTVPFPKKTEIERIRFYSFQHARKVPWTRRASRGVRAGRRPRASTNHGRHAGGQRLGNLLRTDEVNMRIDAASGKDFAFARKNFRPRTND